MARPIYPLPYFPARFIAAHIEVLTDAELDPLLWRDDPSMHMEASLVRDAELLLDLTGNLDSCA